MDYLQQNYLELIGAVLSLLCVWLNTKAHIAGWLVSILATAVYAVVAWQAQLYGFLLINIFFFLLSVYGWLYWLMGSRTEQPLPISRLTLAARYAYIGLGGLLAVVMGYALQHMGGQWVWIDAITTAFSLVAQWLLARKKIENWIFWIFVNICYVVLFCITQLWVSMLLYVGLLGLAVRGWWSWRLLQSAQPADAE